jgi:methylated-DNA-[protein]-cysteine S-methyltransferase
MKTIYWTHCCAHSLWYLTIAATDEGLIYVGVTDDLRSSLHKKYRSYEFDYNEDKMKPFVDEFESYFKKERTSFTLPIAECGTLFQSQVWHEVKQIPYGETRTYEQIAIAIGNPKAVRAVGAAIGANPVLIVVPCHRVISKSGELTGYRDGIWLKEKLLQLERSENSYSILD